MSLLQLWNNDTGTVCENSHYYMLGMTAPRHIIVVLNEKLKLAWCLLLTSDIECDTFSHLTAFHCRLIIMTSSNLLHISRHQEGPNNTQSLKKLKSHLYQRIVVCSSYGDRPVVLIQADIVIDR